MRAHPRIEEYHRRRQRLARRRRSHGWGRLRRPGSVGLSSAPALRLRNGLDGELRDALRELTRRALAYRAVTGLLFLRGGDHVAVRVVAEHPMTGPLRLLSSSWCDELHLAHPEVAWTLDVADRAPPPEQRYQCLYWCQH